MAENGGALGPALQVAQARVLVGTCSWTDATLVKETDWYPKRSMSAAERLAFYASRFPVVEVDSTYYFPPTPELSGSWVQRTPDGFTMNVKAWSLLTGHPTFPHSLWPDLQAGIAPEHRDKRRLYAKHLVPAALDEAWDRFRHSLMPLHSAGRMGAVLLQYPRWFGPKEANREEIRAAVARLPDYQLCVEFRNGRWLAGDECERTFELLESLGVTFVCVDEPSGFPSSVPPVVAATADLAVVRFHGRNEETWEAHLPSAAERFRYRYRREELEEWVPKVRELAASAREVHLLMNNCYRDYAVDNAAELAALLQG
ncbi:MAG TPA: DUF72 domain-containing protein [Acidimicrobiales bacterium]|nr:DUF72 domain-containing protein [Acidimicrobiales bacterium]